MEKNPPANAGHIRDMGSIPRSGRSLGGRHGNPIQYLCLENPMDRGAWRATVHRVAKSQTRIKQFSINSTSDNHLIGKRFFVSISMWGSHCYYFKSRQDVTHPSAQKYYESKSFMIIDAKFLSKMLSKSNLIVVFDVQLVNSASVEPSYTENWVQGTWASLDFGIPGSPGISPLWIPSNSFM